MNLPETTTDRLLAVADIIDLTPERWDQNSWFSTAEFDLDGDPQHVVGQGIQCGSMACIAGWGVALTPRSAQNQHWRSWDVAGSHALGLSIGLGLKLFRADLPMEAAEVADVLRRLAKLPEGERDIDRAAQVLTDGQYDLLTLFGRGGAVVALESNDLSPVAESS